MMSFTNRVRLPNLFIVLQVSARNPVRENVKVYVSKIKTGATVQLYNVNGSLVRSAKLINNANTIQVKDLAAGMYYLVVRNADQTTEQNNHSIVSHASNP